MTQRSGQVFLVLADREHQDAGLGRDFTQGRNGVDAIDAGQVVVQQDQVGLKLLCAAQCLAGIGGVARHLEMRVTREQGGQAAPEQRVVVHHQDADAPGRGT